MKPHTGYIIRQLPNGVTLLNLLSGTLSVFFCYRGNTELAAGMVFLAAIFDFLDGFTARLLHSYSDLGKELDSLADLVSFGVAPAFLMYQLILFSLEPSQHKLWCVQTLQYLPALLVLCAGVRLALFNINPPDQESFSGMPTPANGIFFASYALAFQGKDDTLSTLALSPWIITLALLLFSFLMVSTIPMLTVKFSHLRWQGNEYRYILVAVSLVLLILLHLTAIPFIIVAYLAVSLVRLSGDKQKNTVS